MNANIILLVLAGMGTAVSLVLFTIAAVAEHRANRDVKTTALASVQSKALRLPSSETVSSSQLLSSPFRQEPTRPAVAIYFTALDPTAARPPLGRAAMQSRMQMLEQESPPNPFIDERFILQLKLTGAKSG